MVGNAKVQKPELLRERVYAGVKNDIVSGELQPGQIINEAHIAEQYGMSKTPVREALCLLAFEGLLNPLPRTGYMVTPITVRDVQEAYHLRLLLEMEAARLAIQRITDAEIKELERKMDGRTFEEMRVWNREFHLIIARASGNRRLASLIEGLLDDMDRMFTLDPHISQPTGPYEHADIIEALKKRDLDALLDATSKHVEEGKMRVLERF